MGFSSGPVRLFRIARSNAFNVLLLKYYSKKHDVILLSNLSEREIEKEFMI